MKLKKIASLALAGVMAVSMLAGCANKPGTPDDNGGDQGEATSATISDIMNQAQDADNDAKVAFSDNALLNAALQADVAEKGLGVDANSLKAAAQKANVNDKTAATNTTYSGLVAFYDPDTKLWDDDLNYYYGSANVKGVAGTYTTVNYVSFEGYADEATALKAIANYMQKNVFSKLAAHSAMTNATATAITDADNITDSTKITVDDYYYTYSYTGNATLIIKNNVDGTTDYGVFYVINQKVDCVQY